MGGNLFLDLVVQYGYLGIFIVSLVSNGSIILPVPYLFVIYGLGTTNLFNPILVAVSAGVGATFGELTLYFLSALGRYKLPEAYRARAEKLKVLIDRYGPFIIFIFALTPLPDDLIYPILGVVRYSLVKTFISCFLGKALLALFIYLAGIYSAGFVSVFLGGESILANVVAVVLGILLAIILLRVEWEKYINIEDLAGGGA